MQTLFDLDPAIRPDSKEDQTERIRNALTKAVGRVLIPAGNYRVSGTILAIRPGFRPSLVGEGIGTTVFTLAESLTEPLITIYGANYDRLVGYVTFEDLEVNAGGSTIPAIIDCRYAAYVSLSRVFLHECHGAALRGYCLWDSVLRDCHAVRCGTPDIAAVHLANGQYNDGYLEKCNNVVMDNLRVEQCPYMGVYLGSFAARNRILACKFDRVAAPLLLVDTEPNIITACQFVECNDTTLVNLAPGAQTVVSSCLFDCRRSLAIRGRSTTRGGQFMGNVCGDKMAGLMDGVDRKKNRVEN